MTRFAQLLFAVSCLAIVICADYVRLSLGEVVVEEPREWKADNLWANINLVTQNQNLTSNWSLEDTKWERGTRGTASKAWKDITISGNEPNLTLSFAIYNVGDKDPQAVGLRITSLILSIPSRIPVVGHVATAIKIVIDVFKGAYECEGPVAVNVIQLSQQNLRAMAYNQTTCETLSYQYETGAGCVDVNPLTRKNSTYHVKHCYVKQRGQSNAQELPNSPPKPSGSVRLHARFDFVGGIFLLGVVALFVGMY